MAFASITPNGLLTLAILAAIAILFWGHWPREEDQRGHIAGSSSASASHHLKVAGRPL